MPKLTIGTVGSNSLLAGELDYRQSLARQIADSEIDHLFIADHVSFHTGVGMDGMLNAATLAAMIPRLNIFIGVYLLALRHPVTVARALSSLSLSAPGRIVLGVGVGGEDRHEMEICGVNPATRGKQTNHSLQALRGLLSGKPTTYDCSFFSFEDALIKPAPSPQIRFIIGGRSNAAIQRAAKYGDGWLGVWCSAKRFASVISEINVIAENSREKIPIWEHGLQIWTSVDSDQATARDLVAKGMENLYRMPFERFEKYSPYGTPEQIAEFLVPYIESGARTLNIMPCASSEEASIEAVSKISELLHREYPDL